MDVRKGRPILLVLVVLALALLVPALVTAPTGPIVPGCPAGTQWWPEEAICISSCSPPGAAGPNGPSLIGDACDNPILYPSWYVDNSSYYCSAGQDDTYQIAESVACCPPGEYWDGFVCIPSVECFGELASVCDFDLASDIVSYATDPGCFDPGETNFDTGWSCCQINLYGTPTYNYSINPAPVFMGPDFAGVEFCANAANTVWCGPADGICPEDYFPGNPHSCLAVPDPDCVSCGAGTTFNATSGVCDETNCADGIDNDGDNLTDACDPSCTPRQCNSGTCCDLSDCTLYPGPGIQSCSAGLAAACVGGDGSCVGTFENEMFCDGFSTACPAPTNTTYNVPNNMVCVGGANVSVDSTNYCGSSQAVSCSVGLDQIIGNRLACNGLGTCNVVTATTYVNVTCAGAPENSMCIPGQSSCQDACWSICNEVNCADGLDNDGDGGIDFAEDNNLNAVNDSLEGGVCTAQCSYANCRSIAYDFGGCVVPPPGGIGVWTDESASFACPIAGNSCYCGVCPGISHWNASESFPECRENPYAVPGICSNGVDDDQDGLMDLADPDCSVVDTAPTITSFTAVPNSGVYPLTVTFTMDITDDGPIVDYQLNNESGVTVYDTVGGAPLISDVYVHTYQQPGIFFAELNASDLTSSGNRLYSPPSGVVINAYCMNGTPGGVPVGSPRSCCAGNCYYAGSCYNTSDAGGLVCPGADTICSIFSAGTFNVHDRDNETGGALYAGTSATCAATTWVANGWCEDGINSTAVPNAAGATRCDTVPDLTDNDRAFMCGDDPNELYSSTFWGEACLNSAYGGGCYGQDIIGNDRHYSGVEECLLVNDDNDCDGLFPLSDPDCFSSIAGTVTLNKSDGSTGLAPFASVWDSASYGPPSYSPNTTAADNVGDYSIASVPFGWHNVSARFSGSVTGSNNSFIPPSTAVTGHDIILQELVCNADCTNNLGLCDSFCIGRNGCFAPPGTPERRTMDACAPPGSNFGKSFGEQVFLNQNATHREVGICCSLPPTWEPAPKADLQGNMSNLVKYTRLVTINSIPARMVIASWDR